MRKLILFTFMFVGCAKGPNNIDPSFQALYDQFLADAASNNINLSINQGITIQFVSGGSLGDSYVGLCSNIGYGNNTVSIDQDYWNYINTSNSSYSGYYADDNSNYSQYSAQQQILMYHELGHCLLSEGHNTANTESIMYWELDQPNDSPASLESMIVELFQNYGITIDLFANVGH